MRKSRHFSVELTENYKQALLSWAVEHEHVAWYDSNSHRDAHTSYDALLAVGHRSGTSFQNLQALTQYLNGRTDWLFGYFSYDLKNEFEALCSKNFDGLGFDQLYFFIPEKIILFKGDIAEFLYLQDHADEMEVDFKHIEGLTHTVPKAMSPQNVKIKLRIRKEAYFEKVQHLLRHIHRGDVYEANFCQEFYAVDTKIDPIATYLKLNSISSPPFAAFLKIGERYLLSASPERYLQKKEHKIISQPIKGTAARSSDIEEDQQLKQLLAVDSKERAENIMITDLVRNDLSRIAESGSVQVEELCKVYSYQQVHQMISTISCTVVERTNLLEVIRHTFPMGSMTGAPKIAAMQLIEELEETKRGLYSGALGYFSPDKNFDFNVVIRSILYNAENNYVSYSVGSAITAKSEIEKEYQECLLKAKAMRSVL